jgi:histidinol dehydrogenase
MNTDQNTLLYALPTMILYDEIENAGSIFSRRAQDYASGTNHTLPTNGYAKIIAV